MSKLSLRFVDEQLEQVYRDYVIDRTMLFCRISWAMFVMLCGSFGFLDHRMFGEQGGLVLSVRLAVMAVGVIVFGLTFVSKARRFFSRLPALFILVTGLFCLFLTAYGDRATVSPYFIGFFFAFAGVFITTGVGFSSSAIAFIINLVLFVLTLGFVTPVSPNLFLLYSFFVVGVVLIFGYAAYLIEHRSRETYAVSAQLANSLNEVKKLSGLLPICASCKNVRDDQGYWRQIEQYITTHSEAIFSHSICPDCARKLYPELLDDVEDKDKLEKALASPATPLPS